MWVNSGLLPHALFAQQGEFEASISELLSNPPGWTDIYYEYSGGDRLDQIIDTAYFVRSHHASLVQLADLIALVLRRYSALADGGDHERYPGEANRIGRWIDIFRPRLFARSYRLPLGDDPLVSLFRELCPPSRALLVP